MALEVKALGNVRLSDQRPASFAIRNAASKPWRLPDWVWKLPDVASTVSTALSLTPKPRDDSPYSDLKALTDALSSRPSLSS